MQKFLLFFLFPIFFIQAQSDGVLDESFGDSGYVRTHIGDLDDEINDFFINEDNSIVTIGRTYKGGGDYDFALSKLTESGELDENFGENGINITTNLPRGIPSVIIKLNNGKILAGGIYSPQFGSTYAVLVRYNEDGTIDETFAESGKLFLPYTAIRYIRTMQKQEDDKIVIGGYKTLGSNAIATIIRLNANGTFDNSFNGTGILNLQNSSIEKLIIQQDGKYIVGGGISTNISLARINSDGSLDTTFGDNGKVEWDIEADDDFNDFTLSNSGEIFVTGTSIVNYDYRTFISKISTNGELDADFGINGSKILSLINYDYSRSEQPSSIILDPNNHYIYIGGYFNTDYSSYSYNGFIAKLNMNGGIVEEFGEDGILNFGYTFNRVYKILFDNGGRIIAGGEEEYGEDDFMQARVITTTELNTHTITISASPSIGGIVTGGGDYDFGTSATVTAAANVGYAFVNWTENGNVISTDSEFSFMVESDRNLVATFTESMSVTDWTSVNIEFYPNPVRDFIYIKSQKAVENISVFDLSGQRVFSNIKSENGRIDLRNQESGTYLFRVILVNGETETFKIIKR
ncbi:MAG TPA: T9SS type A sorting domain-containing protein [Moheibacter sp.]|nr:T9SS type A sorting domain-containing protein [Moheibacter sp.]